MNSPTDKSPRDGSSLDPSADSVGPGVPQPLADPDQWEDFIKEQVYPEPATKARSDYRNYETPAREGVRESLQSLVGAIDLPSMQRANLGVDVEHRTPRRAATELLAAMDARK